MARLPSAEIASSPSEVSGDLCSALLVSRLISTVEAANTRKPLFQVLAFEKGTDRFANDGPEKTKPILELLIMCILSW